MLNIKKKKKRKLRTISKSLTSNLNYKTHFRGRRCDFYLYRLGDKENEEIIYISARDNNTKDYRDNDYNKIYFSESKKFYETSQAYMFKEEINILIEKKVLNRKGDINIEKLKYYINKYHVRIRKN